MKTIDAMIEVMSAFKAGKAIQHKPKEFIDDKWIDTNVTPCWDWLHNDYRIKRREPRRIWVNCRADGKIGNAWETKEEAERISGGSETVEFVEIIKP